jgi:serine/threonine protein phosphatase 1
VNLKHAIGIDADAARGGWLTCLDIKGEVAHQTNEAGEYWMRKMISLLEK